MKGKSKKSKNKKILSIIISVLVIAGFAAWYLYGKPQLLYDENGLYLVETETPLINELKAAANSSNSGTSPEGSTTASKSVASNSASPVSNEVSKATVSNASSAANNFSNSAASGTSGSNPALDAGHEENSPLYFGNPSDALPQTEAALNYLMEKPQFTICYNSQSLNPNWVAWHLSSSDLGEADRADSFRPDSELPDSWYAVRKQDYKFPAYGFDRGHICPSADRTASTEDNSMTFLMTNMVPQAPDNNRIVWVALEKYEREQVLTGKEAYIFAGPYGKGGSGDKGYFEEIPISLQDGSQLTITVPSHTWKIILFLPEGEDDASRVGQEAELLAVCVPNEKGCGKNGSWEQYLCSVNYIEEITGYDFFELLEDSLEEEIESRVMSW